MTAKTDSLEIGVLVYPGAQSAAVHGLTDLFTVANRVAAELGEHQLPLLRVSHWQLDAAGQLQVIHDSLPQAGHAPRAMLIPPSLAATPSGELLAAHRPALCDLHGQGTVLASVCIGVFLIAGSGLLDGRSACTHWNYAQALSERFPKVRVATSQPLLDDGDIVTSAGLMAWTDLGLHLIERFLGHTLARETARYLAVEPAPAPVPGALFTRGWNMATRRCCGCSIGCRVSRLASPAWPTWPAVQGSNRALSCGAFVPPPACVPPSMPSKCGLAGPAGCWSSPGAVSTRSPGASAIRTPAPFARCSSASPA